ncbi:hypothetical protein OnM2_000038, partial [Erysiphe neolycopersici]
LEVVILIGYDPGGRVTKKNLVIFLLEAYSKPTRSLLGAYLKERRAGPRAPTIQLEDENHREFFRNHELWLRAKGWLYVFQVTSEELQKNSKLELEKGAFNSENFERHNASARYFTRQLLNSFDRELFDSIPCSKLAWARLKNEYQKSNPKDVRKLERKLTHWKKDR